MKLFLTGTAAEILPLRELYGRYIGGRAGASKRDESIGYDSVTGRLQRHYFGLKITVFSDALNK